MRHSLSAADVSKCSASAFTQRQRRPISLPASTRPPPSPISSNRVGYSHSGTVHALNLPEQSFGAGWLIQLTHLLRLVLEILSAFVILMTISWRLTIVVRFCLRIHASSTRTHCRSVCCSGQSTTWCSASRLTCASSESRYLRIIFWRLSHSLLPRIRRRTRSSTHTWTTRSPTRAA